MHIFVANLLKCNHYFDYCCIQVHNLFRKSARHFSRAVSAVRSSLYRYASVNSSCAQRPPPRADPRALASFLPWLANSRGWGLLSCQIPRGGDEKGGLIPHPSSTLQHFSLIAQSNYAVLIILMCDFSFQLTSSFVIALGFWWRLHAATACSSLGF